MEVYANGLLCAKPKVKKRKIYKDYQICLQEFESCNKKSATLIISNCFPDWDELGDFLCSYTCPEGFVDEDLFCKPETIENYDYTYDQLAARID